MNENNNVVEFKKAEETVVVEETVENKEVATETETIETKVEKPAEPLNLFEAFGIELPKAEDKKKKANSCAAKPTNGKKQESKPATHIKAKEKMPTDVPILVVMVNNNYQRGFEAGLTLEEIRQELEFEFPFLTAQNTNWTWEVQRIKDGRVLLPNATPKVETKKEENKADAEISAEIKVKPNKPEETEKEDAEEDPTITKRILAIPTVKSNKAG